MCRPFPVLPLLFVTVLWGGWLHCPTVADHHGLCRRIKFSVWISGYALKYHVIKNLSLFPVPSIHSACKNRCIMDPVCVSVNIGPPTKDKFICELSDSDHIRHPKDVKRREGFMYMGPEDNPCLSNPCLHDSTCLNGYTDKQYLCECQAGYTGEHCEKGGGGSGFYSRGRSGKNFNGTKGKGGEGGKGFLQGGVGGRSRFNNIDGGFVGAGGALGRSNGVQGGGGGGGGGGYSGGSSGNNKPDSCGGGEGPSTQ